MYYCSKFDGLMINIQSLPVAAASVALENFRVPHKSQRPVTHFSRYGALPLHRSALTFPYRRLAALPLVVSLNQSIYRQVFRACSDPKPEQALSH